MKLYHISSLKNRQSIIKNGLIAQCGERSARFGQFENRVYVVDKLWKINKLISYNLWKTHPDFKDGFDIYEVQDTCTLNKDEKYDYGLYTTSNLKNIKLITTIPNGK